MTPPARSVHAVGPGDYIKVAGQWLRIASIDLVDKEGLTKAWTVHTATGVYGMFDIERYAKAEDLP